MCEALHNVRLPRSNGWHRSTQIKDTWAGGAAAGLGSSRPGRSDQRVFNLFRLLEANTLFPGLTGGLKGHQLAKGPAAPRPGHTLPGRGWISFSCVQFSAMTPRPLSLAALLVSSCLGALIWGASQAAGHGMLSEPAARNVLANSDYCPQCLSAGGERPASGWMGRAAAAAVASGHTRRTSFL